MPQVINKWLHPVAFYLMKFNKAKVYYNIHDKELLSIVTAFQEWRHYPKGSKEQIVINTDHKKVEYFISKESLLLNQQQAQWAEYLSQFNFHIIYQLGTQGGKLNALSRKSEYYLEEGGSDQPVKEMFHPSQLIISVLKKIKKESNIGRSKEDVMATA